MIQHDSVGPVLLMKELGSPIQKHLLLFSVEKVGGVDLDGNNGGGKN